MRRTGCYRCVRASPSDGSCGIGSYPCMHPGCDLFAKDSTVFAPDNGVVVAVASGSSAPWVGYGPAIIEILGDSGKYLLMAHLDQSSINVAVGQRVTEGQPIARFDAATGHTHFEVRTKATGPWETNTSDPAIWVAQGSPTSWAMRIALAGFVIWGGMKLWGKR
jgi:murein DD-endopeptidase MepM/ murein hydrolase activator NlpD